MEARATTWPTLCRCGRTWSERAWRELIYVGEFVLGDATVEMRECECGSTISVHPHGPFAPSSGTTTRRRRFDLETVRPHLLVVDDDPVIARIVERGLAGAWRTSVASDGEGMVNALVHGARFDAILLDVEMPGVPLVELVARVRRVDPGLDRRIVFMTGGTTSEATRAFLTAMQNSLLRKPFPFPVLRELLDLVYREASGPIETRAQA